MSDRRSLLFRMYIYKSKNHHYSASYIMHKGYDEESDVEKSKLL